MNKHYTIEMIKHSRALLISGVVETEHDHHFLTRTYYGYSKKQAVALWYKELEDQARA